MFCNYLNYKFRSHKKWVWKRLVKPVNFVWSFVNNNMMLHVSLSLFVHNVQSSQLFIAEPDLKIINTTFKDYIILKRNYSIRKVVQTKKNL